MMITLYNALKLYIIQSFKFFNILFFFFLILFCSFAKKEKI